MRLSFTSPLDRREGCDLDHYRAPLIAAPEAEPEPVESSPVQSESE